MSDLTKKNPEHKVYLDVLRILCITLVVFNHTPAYNQPILSPTIENLFTLLICISVKVAVPIFFMISGSLLLKKEESLTQLLHKRVLRFVFVIILFGMVQYLQWIFRKGINPSLVDFLTACDNPGKVGATVGWFLYAYLGFLLMLPLLRSMVKNLSHSFYIYSIVLFLLFQVVLPSFVSLVCGKVADVAILPYIPLISGDYIKVGAYSLLYFTLGYYLEEKLILKKVSYIIYIIIGFFSIIFIVLDALLTCYVANTIGVEGKTIEHYSWFFAAVLPACVFIYLLVKKIFLSWNISPRFQWLLSKLGGAVFTVFFIENILRNAYSPLFENYNKEYWPSVWVTLLTVASGLVIGLIVKQIPGLKKIL